MKRTLFLIPVQRVLSTAVFAKKAFLSLAVFALFSVPVSADTIYFKDGRVWTGLIQGEDGQKIDLDLGFDTANLEKEKIAGVHRSKGDEALVLQKKLQRIKNDSKKIRLLRGSKPTTVTLHDDGNGHFFVKVRLNDRYDAELVLDTGASTVVLSRALAQKMGLEKNATSQIVELKVADGRTSRGVYLPLASVEVQGARATHVGAVFATGDFNDEYLKDGLLGMSYLSRFGFRIDFQHKKMTLEKIS